MIKTYRHMGFINKEKEKARWWEGEDLPSMEDEDLLISLQWSVTDTRGRGW